MKLDELVAGSTKSKDGALAVRNCTRMSVGRWEVNQMWSNTELECQENTYL